MNIILFGAPGSGKGTQSDFIVKDLKSFKISTGDLLRNAIRSETLLGKKIKNIIDKGNLVSDQIINNLIESIIIKKKSSSGYVFDGYPRTINQANDLSKLLTKFNQKISCAFYLDVNQDILVKRVVGRISCLKCQKIFNDFFNPPNCNCGSKYLNKRSDDNEETAKKRFVTFTKETYPILNYYEDKKNLYKVNGNEEIPKIYKEIKDIISSLKD